MKHDLNLLFEVAKNTSKKSPCKHKVVCILVDKRDNIVSVGYNHFSSRSSRLGKNTIHAECDAVSKVRKPSSNLTAFLYRHGKNEYGNPIHSCSCCATLLKAYGIREVISMHTLEG